MRDPLYVDGMWSSNHARLAYSMQRQAGHVSNLPCALCPFSAPKTLQPMPRSRPTPWRPGQPLAWTGAERRCAMWLSSCARRRGMLRLCGRCWSWRLRCWRCPTHRTRSKRRQQQQSVRLVSCLGHRGRGLALCVGAPSSKAQTHAGILGMSLLWQSDERPAQWHALICSTHNVQWSLAG